MNSAPGAGQLYRRGQMPCDYETYVPDQLAGRAIRLDGDVAADVAEAEAAISELNAQVTCCSRSTAALVPELMADLCSFCNQDSLPAVAQAALAHAQFETIHPFADGNGRTGRGLIQLVLRRRGLATRTVPPVSLVLATWAKDYLDGLTATRYLGPAAGESAHEGINLWIGRFAGACIRTVHDAASFEMRMQEMEVEWRARVGKVRAGSGTDLLLRALPGAPVLTVASAAELIGRSFPAVNDAIARPTEADVLKQITIGKRNRAFEAMEVTDAFASLERQLASPAGDTRSSPPSRPVRSRCRLSRSRAGSPGSRPGPRR